MVRSKVKKLKDLLVHAIGDDFEIIEENYKMLTPPGEHYGSIMLAVDVAIKRPNKKEEVLNLVAKLIPVHEMLRNVFNIGITFKKEVSAYLDAIPALIQLQEEYNFPENEILDMFPKCYGARISLDQNKNEVDDNAAIIFENLKVQGYIMEDRMVGFDLKHAELIVRDLAKFHSAGIALRKLKPDVFKEKVGPSILQCPSLERLPPSFRECVIEFTSITEETKSYVQRLKDFMEKSLEQFKQPQPLPNDAFATAIHSDYWVNNTLVLRDKNGNPIKNRMVDMQLLTYASCVRDLLFFLFTSVINSVLDENYDNLIKLYHDEFIYNMRYFGLDLEQFSWDAYMNEVEYIGPEEAYHIIVMIKPIFTERNKITNSLEDFQESDWNREDLLGESYRRKLRDTILALDRRNWL